MSDFFRNFREFLKRKRNEIVLGVIAFVIGTVIIGTILVIFQEALKKFFFPDRTTATIRLVESDVPAPPRVEASGPAISWDLPKERRARFLDVRIVNNEARVISFYLKGRTHGRPVTQSRIHVNRPMLGSGIRRMGVPLMLDGQPFAGKTIPENTEFTITASFSSEGSDGIEFGRFIATYGAVRLNEVVGAPDHAFSIDDVVAHLPPGGTYVGRDYQERMDLFHELLTILEELSAVFDSLEATLRAWGSALVDRGKSAYLSDIQKAIDRLGGVDGPLTKLVRFLERTRSRYTDYKYMLTGGNYPPLFDRINEFRTQVGRITTERPSRDEVQILQPHWVPLEEVVGRFGEWRNDRITLVRTKRDQERNDSGH